MLLPNGTWNEELEVADVLPRNPANMMRGGGHEDQGLPRKTQGIMYASRSEIDRVHRFCGT